MKARDRRHDPGAAAPAVGNTIDRSNRGGFRDISDSSGPVIFRELHMVDGRPRLAIAFAE